MIKSSQIKCKSEREHNVMERKGCELADLRKFTDTLFTRNALMEK